MVTFLKVFYSDVYLYLMFLDSASCSSFELYQFWMIGKGSVASFVPSVGAKKPEIVKKAKTQVIIFE